MEPVKWKRIAKCTVCFLDNVAEIINKLATSVMEDVVLPDLEEDSKVLITLEWCESSPL